MIDVIRRYRYVVLDRDRHGNVRVYLRLPGKPKVRLREQPGTDAFDAEYRRALEAGPAPPKKVLAAPERGTLHALCVSYYESNSFKGMEPRSRHVRRLILDKLCAEKGTRPAARMEARHVEKLRDAKAETPEAANSLVKALRAVFRHGVAAHLVPNNPALAVAYLRSAGQGFHTWTLDEVEQFERCHPIGTKARLALALLLYTGQRRSDVVLFGRQHVRDGWLTFTQQKNRNRKPVKLSLPIVPELQRIIDATPSGDLTFLTSERGTPYSPDSFGNRFRAWCRAAGLPHCSPHGLRKAAASRLAELGCSAHEIMAVTGHRTLKEVLRYTMAAGQKRMVELLRAVKRRRGAELVFEGPRKNVPSGFGKVKARLDEALAKAAKDAGRKALPWTLHDIRRTVATGFQRLGVRLEVTEAVLNHVSGSRAGIVGVYQRHGWDREKAEALRGWAAHVRRCGDSGKAEATSKVVALRTAAPAG